jgi:hypothetical protein
MRLPNGVVAVAMQTPAGCVVVSSPGLSRDERLTARLIAYYRVGEGATAAVVHMQDMTRILAAALP